MARIPKQRTKKEVSLTEEKERELRFRQLRRNARPGVAEVAIDPVFEGWMMAEDDLSDLALRKRP